jgi:uncharacterized protein
MSLVGPTSQPSRIQALDVVRGFALLGILLLNILGFGLVSSGYFNPLVGSPGGAFNLNLSIWASVDVLFEGAMRGLFSMLFGAGVVLFTTGSTPKSGLLHYRRQFWLFVFGLVDAFVLLWTGDILCVYAMGGALLYLCRNLSARRLLISASIMLILLSLYAHAQGLGMAYAQGFAQSAAAGEPLTADEAELAYLWTDFEADYAGEGERVSAELVARKTSYISAFNWTAVTMTEYFTFVVPTILFWDALVMMLFGMALFKYGVLDASRSNTFYWKLTIFGFGSGLAFNLYEVTKAFASGFDLLTSFPYFQATYHPGRFGMALGYTGLVMLICKSEFLPGLRNRLTAVGRMALTNYLMHSVICLFIFTGAGFGLVNDLERSSLYLIVLAIRVLQLALSPWWLERFAFGPVEWLWRWLTYGDRPDFRHPQGRQI